MKKLFTLMAGALLGVGGMTAATPATIANMPENLQLSQEGMEKLQQLSSQLQTDMLLGKTEGGMKRTYTDRQGVTWNSQFLVQNMILGDLLAEKADGSTYTIEEIPYGIVASLLWQYDESGRPMTQIIEFLAWPTYYTWDQIFTWPDDEKVWYSDTEWDVPEDKKDFKLVDYADFCNELPWQSKTFRVIGERESAVPAYTPDGFANFVALPMFVFNYNSLLNGAEAYPQPESTITMGEYDEAERIQNVNYLYIVTLKDNSRTQTVRCNYSGTGRLEGFNPTTYAPAMGDLHIFNFGVLDTDDPMFDSPFYESKFKLQAYKLYGLGEKIDIAYAGTSADNTANLKIGFSESTLDSEMTSENINYYIGFVFCNPGEEPLGKQWRMIEGEYNEVINPITGEPVGYYYDMLPLAGTFFPNDYLDNWSEDYGMNTFIEENSIALMPNFVVTVQSNEGSGIKGVDYYHNTDIMLTKTGKVVYHYDEKDFEKRREYDAVGDHELVWDPENVGVEGVAAETGVKVGASNGIITVAAAEASDVTVVALNGAVVKSAKLAAGETMSVNADKGLYIVKAGKSAVKVVL